MKEPTESRQFASYDAFWLHYLDQHRRLGTRLLHYAGTSLGLLSLAGALLTQDWRLLVAAPAIGYAFAWVGHFGLEGNRPATFGHPVWSFLSDFRMLWLALSGQLKPELDRLAAR
jgi:hypothetical protein